MNTVLLPATDTAKADAYTVNPKKTNNDNHSFSDSFNEVKREVEKQDLDKKSHQRVTHQPFEDSKDIADSVENKQSTLTNDHNSDMEISHTPSDDKPLIVTPISEVTTVNNSDLKASLKEKLLSLSQLIESGSGTSVSEVQINDISSLLSELINKSDDELVSFINELSGDESTQFFTALFPAVDTQSLQQQLAYGGKNLPLNADPMLAISNLRQLVNQELNNLELKLKALNNSGAIDASEELTATGEVSKTLSSSSSLTELANHSIKNHAQQSNEQALSSVSPSLMTSSTEQDLLLSKSAIDDALKALGTPETRSTSSPSTIEGVLNSANAIYNAPLSKAQLSINTPFQQAQWGQHVSDKVMWMSSQGLQEAEIHLDPPELGPLQVRVSVVNEQAHVSFVVQHSSVREALDQNAMRLRDMFEGEGVELVDVDVSDQSEQQASDSEGEKNDSGLPFSDENNTLSSETSIRHIMQGSSLINTYV